MATSKSYTDIEQSKKLAEILPLESADMVLPFRHPKNDEYIPGYVVSRNYVEVYNEMIKLPGMGKEDVCKLIQPSWSLAALLNIINTIKGWYPGIDAQIDENMWQICMFSYETGSDLSTAAVKEELVDTCYEVILKLKEKGLL